MTEMSFVKRIDTGPKGKSLHCIKTQREASANPEKAYQEPALPEP